MSKNKAVQDFFINNPEFKQDLNKIENKDKLDIFIKIAERTGFIKERISDELAEENLLNNVDNLNQPKIDNISKILIDPEFNSIKNFLQNSTGNLENQYKTFKGLKNLYELADIDLDIAKIILSNPGFENIRRFIKNEPYALKALSKLDLASLEIANGIVVSENFKDKEVSKENLEELLKQTKTKHISKNMKIFLLYAGSALSSSVTFTYKNIKIYDPKTDAYSYYKSSNIFDPKIKLFMNNFADKERNSRLLNVFKDLKEENINKLEKFLENKKNVEFAYLYPERLEYVLEIIKDEQEQYIESFLKPQFAHERMMHNIVRDNNQIEFYNVKTEKLNEMLKSNFKGPWRIDPNCYRIMDQLGTNIHLDIPFKYLSLHDLDDFNNIHPIVFAPIDKVGGFANYNLQMVISTKNGFDYQRDSFVHEAMHRIYFTTNSGFTADPYSQLNLKNNLIFKSSMTEVMKNLHKRYLPNEEVPADIKKMAENLRSKTKNLLEQDSYIIMKITEPFCHEIYTIHIYDSEFVVRIPELISTYKGLPAHLIDDFKPILDYYKTVSTPSFLDYIESHPRKHMLLEKDTDKYYPETLLSVAGETRLLLKKNLTKEEKILVNQMKKMEGFLEKGDNAAITAFLPNLKDERVIRYSLNLAIKNGNLDAFSKLYQIIQAPQYLGPQLMEAARLGREEMIPALKRHVTEQYFLAKAAHPETITPPLPIVESSATIKIGSTHLPAAPVAAIIGTVATAAAIYTGYKAFRSIISSISDYFTPTKIDETKNLDKKLLLLQEHFDLLSKKYENTEKGEYFQSLKIQAQETLEKLNELNSFTINSKKEQRKTAIAIFKSFKDLKKIKEELVGARYRESEIRVNFSEKMREEIDKQLKDVNLENITSGYRSTPIAVPLQRDKKNIPIDR